VEDTIGWAFYRKGLYLTALQHLQLSAGKDNTALKNYHLAMAYQMAGQHDRARQALAVAQHQDPNLAEASSARQLIGK